METYHEIINMIVEFLVQHKVFIATYIPDPFLFMIIYVIIITMPLIMIAIFNNTKFVKNHLQVLLPYTLIGIFAAFLLTGDIPLMSVEKIYTDTLMNFKTIPATFVVDGKGYTRDISMMQERPKPHGEFGPWKVIGHAQVFITRDCVDVPIMIKTEYGMTPAKAQRCINIDERLFHSNDLIDNALTKQ